MVRVVAIVLVVVLLIGGAVVLMRGSIMGGPRLTTTYHAILLTNGQVYFGKLQGLGGDYTVLTDVFYVHNRVDPESKQTTSVLIKRGREWHAPDRMLLNARHILIVEPVTDGSQVAKLISEGQQQKK